MSPNTAPTTQARPFAAPPPTPAPAPASAPAPPRAEQAPGPSAPRKLSWAPLPPPPPPPPPQMLPPPKEEMTQEQRRAVWEKRIILMADATRDYMDLGKLDQDVLARRRQVQAIGFESLPEVMRTSFTSGLAAAEAIREEKKASLDGAMVRLAETDFWPIIPSQRVGEVESKLKEAKTMLGALADNVNRLHKRIEALNKLHPSSLGAVQQDPDRDVMEVDDEEGAIPANKRRRRPSADGAAAAASLEMRENVDSIKNSIREIEDRLLEMENDMHQHSRDVMEQVELRIDEKIDEFTQSPEFAVPRDSELGPQATEMVASLNAGFAQADQEIAELAQEMAEFIPRLNGLQRENERIKQDEAADRELFNQLIQKDRDQAEAIARLQEQARQLQSAFAAQALRTMPAPLTDPLPEYVLETIRASIKKQVQDQVIPILMTTRTEVEHIAKSSEAELFEKLKDKLDQSAKMTQVLMAWTEHDPEGVLRALRTAMPRTQGLQGPGVPA
ncbi:hypothetical protein BC834DRAFT_966141 [Gloeopeniophorella convolvens]|nr:hypothetical protein BC834DRAFT_966141 [Gloeopeniophorella convolvens]